MNVFRRHDVYNDLSLIACYKKIISCILWEAFLNAEDHSKEI